MLTRDDLIGLDANKPAPPTKLHVKAWGRDVWLLDPTVETYDNWSIFCEANAGKPAPWRAKLATLLLCDEDGKRLFTDKDVSLLSSWRPDGLVEVWAAGLQLLRVTDAEVQEDAGN